MNNFDYNLYNLSGLTYDVVAAGFKRLGNKKIHPEVDFSWQTTEENKFEHWSHARIWAVKKGSAQVCTTFGEFTIHENMAYFVPQNALISANCEDYMEQYFIDFLPYSNTLPIENLFEFNYIIEDYDFVRTIVQDVIKIHKNKDEIPRIKLTFDMNALISKFISNPKLSFEKYSPFIKIMEQINNSYNTNLSVKELAKQSGYNYEYFSRAFKSTFGVSPQNYIINKRIAEAKHLLLTTTIPISAIAFQCGYPDPLYFTKSFVKYTGLSPTAFREKFIYGS